MLNDRHSAMKRTCVSRRTTIQAFAAYAGFGVLISESNGQSAPSEIRSEMLLGKWQRFFLRGDGARFTSTLQFSSDGTMSGQTVKDGKSIVWYKYAWQLQGNILVQTGSGAIEGVVPPPPAPGNAATDVVTRTHSIKTQIVSLTATELVLKQVNGSGAGQKFLRAQ
jgi:hypothetical protein